MSPVVNAPPRGRYVTFWKRWFLVTTGQSLFAVFAVSPQSHAISLRPVTLRRELSRSASSPTRGSSTGVGCLNLRERTVVARDQRLPALSALERRPCRGAGPGWMADATSGPRRRPLRLRAGAETCRARGTAVARAGADAKHDRSARGPGL